MAGVMMLPAVALLGWTVKASASGPVPPPPPPPIASPRSEEHTSELQSQSNLVCRLLLEKKEESPFATPSVGSIDAAAPLELPGVAAVFTAPDLDIPFLRTVPEQDDVMPTPIP